MSLLSREHTKVNGLVELLKAGEVHAICDLEAYPLRVHLWIEKIAGKQSLRFGIHEIGSDRLRSYFLLSGTMEQIQKKVHERSFPGELARDLEQLVQRWIQSDD